MKNTLSTSASFSSPSNFKDTILLKGVKQHNLKNIDVAFPKENLIVVTGVSGSGKSSLVVDTLYAEGYRRYIESLSSYIRQFLAKVPKPLVDRVENITPSILISQKQAVYNPRALVCTATEIYEYLKLLFYHVGKIISPISNEEVKCYNVKFILEEIMKLPPEKKAYILFPYTVTSTDDIGNLIAQGYNRIYIEKSMVELCPDEKFSFPTILLVVADRFKTKKNYNEGDLNRLADSLEMALREGNGTCYIALDSEEPHRFSEKLEKDGIVFEKPTLKALSFTNPLGACPKCKGAGFAFGIDEDLVIPNKNLPLKNNPIIPWRLEEHKSFFDQFLQNAEKVGIDVNLTYNELPFPKKQLLWKGPQDKSLFTGIIPFFNLLKKTKKSAFAFKFEGKSTCPQCMGKRLKQESLYLKIAGYDIGDFLFMSVDEALEVLQSISFDEYEKKVISLLLPELFSRLQYLQKVGLGYLELNRPLSSLSGGELQRVKLTSVLGNSLIGTTYILDEPTVGLHPRDTSYLLEIIRSLQKQGNTVVVVEHDELFIRQADYIIDLGPKAGVNGGYVVFQGSAKEFKNAKSITQQYLQNPDAIPIYPRNYTSKSPPDYIHIINAYKHNLKNISLKIPINRITVIAGVSGSGKSTLAYDILYKNIKDNLHYAYPFSENSILENPLNERHQAGCDSVKFPSEWITHIEYLDQKALSRSSRSNPATYLGIWDSIRKLYASLPEAKELNLTASHFSFNSPGGRCEACEGQGRITIEMQFLSDIQIQCEVCKGKRFQKKVLDVTYKGFSIADILDLTVDEALQVFHDQKTISSGLSVLKKVGLDYLRLGQETAILSGGEAQRLKIASYLAKEDNEPTLFIFDEPTTGLHLYDVDILLKAFFELIQKGHTIIIIEHHLDVIKNADYLIELGPGSGKEGGFLIFAGHPTELIRIKHSPTSPFLKSKINFEN